MTTLPKCPAHKGLKAPSPKVVQSHSDVAKSKGGFRFLKAPLFFVSSLFVKKPSRIRGLLMVITLALLVYSVAQRRLRQELARRKESLLNQINQPTQRPTLPLQRHFR
jgi:transposase